MLSDVKETNRFVPSVDKYPEECYSCINVTDVAFEIKQNRYHRTDSLDETRFRGEEEPGMGSRHSGPGGRKLAVVFAAAVLAGAGIFLFYYKMYRVVPVFHEITCEYGDRVSRDIEDYITGTDWSVHLADLDLSGVDEEHVGTYQALVRHGRSEFVYTIVVQDTVPPEILLREGRVYVAAGADCSVEDVIQGIYDVDSLAQAFFVQDGGTLSQIRFENPGEYEVEILARDGSGNETRERISVVADTPPVITGTRDYYLVLGHVPDYTDGIEAWDDVDGSLTSRIQVDDSEVDLEKEGAYQLRYAVTDQYGLETVEKVRVLVAEADDIQELIGHRKINYRKDVILGAPNIYDGGAAGQENMEETLQYVLPSFVQLYHPTGRGGYTSGSGFIMEISGDKIYICSNRHVVEKYQDWEIYFYDGTMIKGTCLGYSDIYDVGVVTVELEDVPEELLERLMTVHIDMTYWNGLDTQAVEVGLERVDREGGLLHVSSGTLVKARQDFEWYERRHHTEVDVPLVHGDSGSALVDGYGNLICMAYGFSNGPVRYWCVPLDGILECYQEITGRMPYVY